MNETIEKPWGNEQTLAYFGQPTTTKIMIIKNGTRNSLHYHKKKSEYVYCLSGVGILQNNTELIQLVPGKVSTVDKNVAHRITSLSDDDLKILEISIGEYDKDDIYRMEDDYGRS